MALMMRFRGGALALIALLSVGCGGDDEDEDGVSNVDGKAPPTGWRAAVGDNGVLVQTFDDQIWDERVVADGDLYAVTCVGNELGWAAGEGGAVLHTSDAGATWHRQDSHTKKDLRAVRLAHGTDGVLFGVVAGDGGTLRVTRDGGDTWRSVPVETTRRLWDAAIAHDRKLVVVVGEAGVVLRSVDEAKTFASATISGAGDLSGVAVDAAGQRVLAADASGIIWASFDRGVTFVRDADARAPLWSIALAEDGTWGLAAGDDGVSLERDLLGRWSTLTTGTSATLRATMISHDGRRGYAAGNDGTLRTMTGPGTSWTQVDSGTDVTLHALEDLDPQ